MSPKCSIANLNSIHARLSQELRINASSMVHQSVLCLANKLPDSASEAGLHKDSCSLKEVPTVHFNVWGRPKPLGTLMSALAQNFIHGALTAIATFQYYTTSAIVLFYYEYLLTLDREVRLVWKRRFSSLSILFLCLRYTTFLAYIPTLLFVVNPPNNNTVCVAVAHFPGAMSTVSLGIITIFLILRTYAVYYRSLWVLAVTVPFGIVNVVLAAWALTKVKTILFTFGSGSLRTCVPAVLISEAPFRAS
ncbi:hypothetical protein SCHPADRAFT_733824 [Schizopora paradoxa]|uniref:DUF6533 domain-containing protein n=1 Tax=Schizopora paradoxa TaxID=27342 RepID=A0A0H2R087_9AGAM|nr:hypothetical protein SCHPADRAFT_733824 [Schizopora paradoxa]